MRILVQSDLIIQDLTPLVRIVWAVLTSGEPTRPDHASRKTAGMGL